MSNAGRTVLRCSLVTLIAHTLFVLAEVVVNDVLRWESVLSTVLQNSLPLIDFAVEDLATTYSGVFVVPAEWVNYDARQASVIAKVASYSVFGGAFYSLVAALAAYGVCLIRRHRGANRPVDEPLS